ncbi:MAG: serine protease [Candidatus Falkowbacteria bacterium]|nr:MAG: serine protease [Candidatus Falkowbacteria bacterium]
MNTPVTTKNNKHRLLPVIILAIFLGLIAGAAGEIVTRVYFLKDFSVPYFNNEVNLASLNSNRSNLIIQDAKKVVVNQDVKVGETIGSIRPSLVGVFKTLAVNEKSSSAQYYKLDEPLLVGLAVTADGWIAISAPADFKKNFNVKNFVAITSDRKVYKIDKISDFDNLPGDLIFFHLEAANNLTVKKIVARTDISLGQSVLAINDFSNVLLTSLSSFKKTPTVLSSDSLNTRFTLAGTPEDQFKNSFVFNLAGDLVAIIGEDKEIVPAFSYNSYWQSFFKTGTASQPLLGVNYLDLSTTKSLSLNLEKGAWLHSSETLPAVVKNSPAANAGLQEGDVISWVNNQALDANNDLADIIASFNPGDNITLTYIRNGVEKEVTLKLGEEK